MDIKLDLSVDEVNIILNALSTRPYVEVAGLIEKIRTMGNKQFEENQCNDSNNNNEAM